MRVYHLHQEKREWWSSTSYSLYNHLLTRAVMIKTVRKAMILFLVRFWRLATSVCLEPLMLLKLSTEVKWSRYGGQLASMWLTDASNQSESLPVECHNEDKGYRVAHSNDCSLHHNNPEQLQDVLGSGLIAHKSCSVVLIYCLHVVRYELYPVRWESSRDDVSKCRYAPVTIRWATVISESPCVGVGAFS